MMISTKGRYALRVMIELAISNPDEYVPLKQIADNQQFPFVSNKLHGGCNRTFGQFFSCQHKYDSLKLDITIISDNKKVNSLKRKLCYKSIA